MAICSIDNCDSPARARNWCGKHYQRWTTTGDPLKTLRSQKAKCLAEGCDNNARARGWCSNHYKLLWTEINNPGERSEQAKSWYERHPGYHRANHIQRKGLTPELFDLLLRSQNNKCAICRTDSPGARGTWQIDHDHDCKSCELGCNECIRGLLCNNCNAGLGFFRDNKELLGLASSYLAKFVDEGNPILRKSIESTNSGT